mgnify:CR=1 FL=1
MLSLYIDSSSRRRDILSSCDSTMITNAAASCLCNEYDEKVFVSINFVIQVICNSFVFFRDYINLSVGRIWQLLVFYSLGLY